MPHDEGNMDEVDSDAEDHVGDETRHVIGEWSLSRITGIVSSTETPPTAGLGGRQPGGALPDAPMGPTVLSPTSFSPRTVGVGPMQCWMSTVGQTLLLVNRGVAEAGDLGEFLAGAADPYQGTLSKASASLERGRA